MNAEDLKLEKRILKKFKDDYAIKMEIPGVKSWYDYIQWCESNGFDEREVGYDALIIDYHLFRIENSTLTRNSE